MFRQWKMYEYSQMVTKVVCAEDNHPSDGAYQAMISHISSRLTSHNFTDITGNLLQAVLQNGKKPNLTSNENREHRLYHLRYNTMTS